MKLRLLATIAAAGAIGAAAAGVVPGHAEAIDLPRGAHHPVLSPDGSRMLFSSDDHTGLKCLDLATGSVTEIDSERGAGFQPVFSLDGSKVFYRTAQKKDRLLQRDLRSYTFGEEAPRLMQPLSRADIDVASYCGGDYAMAQLQSIHVRANGTELNIDPLPDRHTYLWASLSPDGSRLLFCEPFQGVFVSRPDGSEARCILPKGDFPCWAGNDVVVTVVTHDDGYVVLDSTLVAFDLSDGTITNLTGTDTLVSETAATTGKVVYTTIDGEMFMFNLYRADTQL